MKNSVLLVIDMQKIFAPGYEWYTPGIEDAEKNIHRLCEKYKNRIFTRHVASENPIGTWKSYNEEFAHINSNTECLDLLDSFVNTEKIEFDKITYSAFNSGEALQYIKDQGYTEIILTGVQTEFCVLSSLMRAIDEGFFVTFVSDACAGSAEIFNESVSSLIRLVPFQARVKTVDELFAEK